MKRRFNRLLATVLMLLLTFSGIPTAGFAQSYVPSVNPVYIPVEGETENGTLDIYLHQGDAWNLIGQIGYSKWFREGNLSLENMNPTGAPIEVKIVKNAVGLAHMDAVLVDGTAPIEVENGDSKLKDKVSAVDNDVVEIDEDGLLFLFETDAAPLELMISARIEPENIGEIPFAFPETNENGIIDMGSNFYTYTWNDNCNVGTMDGTLDETVGIEPLFEDYTIPGSGHPAGFTYGWVMNDEDYLYATVDFTPDNTVDGDKDYTAMHIRTENGIKVFKVSEENTEWGQPFFTYTDNVSYEHKVYEFKIPKTELDLYENGALNLAFTAYGTAAPDYLYDMDIAFSPVTNQYMLAYVMTDSEAIMHLYMQLLDYSGAPIGEPVVLSDVTYGSTALSMAYNALQDEFVIVCTNIVSDYRNISAMILDSSGGVVKSEFVLHEELVNQYDPVIEYNKDHDSYYVLWKTSTSDDYSWDLSGVEVTSEWTSDVFTIDTNGYYYDTAYNPVNENLEVVYNYNQSPYQQLAYAEVASGGAILVQDELLNVATDYQTMENVVFDPAQSTFVTAWVDETSGSSILIQYDTTTASAITVYETSLPNNNIGDVSIVPRGDTGEFLLVWSNDYNREVYDVYGAYIDSTGNVAISAYDIYDDVDYKYNPCVAYNSNNDTFLVAYESRISASDPSTIATQLIGDPSYGTIGFQSSTISVAEGESLTLTLDRLDGIDGETIIAYETVTGTAISTDFTVASGTLTYKDGDKTNQIVVQTTADNVEEGDETFTVELSLTSGDVTLGTSVITVTIADDDIAGTLDFDQFAYETQEGTSVDLTIVRSGGSDGDITVDVATATGTASSSDFTEKSGTLTIAHGVSTKTVTIDTSADILPEQDENFTVTLSNPTGGASLGSVTTSTVTIRDDDAAGTLQLASPGPSVTEGEDAVFTVYRSDGTAGEITVDYTSSTGTATSGADFTAASGTLTFPAGVTEKTITVSTADDTDTESTEYFTVTISNPTGEASLGAVASSMATIYDNESSAAGEFNFALTTKTVDEGGSFEAEITRTGEAVGAVSVVVTVAPDTADTSDYTVSSSTQTLTFADGDTTSQKILIATVDDTDVEYDEYFTVTLSSPTGDAVLGSDSTMYVVIADNDTSFAFASPTLSYSEGTTVYAYLVRSGDLSAEQTVEVTLQPGTADAEDYVFTPVTTSLTFPANTDIQTISVPITDDASVEGSETFTLAITSIPSGTSKGTNDSVVITIMDNDSMAYDTPVINWSSSTYSVVEGQDVTLTVDYTLEVDGVYDSSAYYFVEFEVTPNTATVDDFSVETGQDLWYDEYADVYMTELSTEKGSLDIVISTVDDSLVEGTHAFTVTLVDNADIDLGTIPAATISIVDNDRSSSSSSSDKKTSSTTNTDTTASTTTPTTTTSAADDATGAVDTAASAEELTSVNTVKSLTTAVTTAIASVETTTEEADEALKGIEDSLDAIQNDEVLSEALDSYIGTIETLGDAATQEAKTEWATTKILEMNATVSKALQKIEDSETLIATTTKMVESLKTIEAEGKVAKTADMKKAVEVLAKGAMNKLGTVKTTTVTQEVDGVTEVSFADADLETKIAKSVENINKVKETFNAYYGGENIRNFGVEVTLETEKTADAVKVKVDQKTIESLEKAGVDTVGIKVGGTKLLLDKEMYQPQEGAAGREMDIDMKFDNKTNGAGTSTANFKKGYMADVNVSMNGEKREVLEKPARLSFDLDEFEFFNDTAGPSSLSVFKLNEATGEWNPVGGVYDPVTNSISTRRISFSQYTVMQSNKSFNDVDDSWAKSEINELLNKGIIDEEVAFNPQEAITREEFTTWVTRAYGLTNEDAEAPFSDIAQDSEHYVEVASAFSAGIVSGSSGSFNPDKAVTKEEMSAILANAMTNYDQKMLSEGIESQLAQVDDGDLISDWAGDDVALLMELGVLDLEEGNLNPKDTMTKEQAAAILKKIYG